MDELVGGSLTLEQRYDIKRHLGRFGSVDVYEGLQRPLNRPIYLHVWVHPEHEDPRIARNWVDRIRTAVMAQQSVVHPNVSLIVDFGDVDQGMPFVVYNRPPGERLSELVEQEGTLSSDEVGALARSLSDTLSVLESAGFAHGALGPQLVFWDGSDARLLNVGLSLTRAEVEVCDGADLWGMFAFPPERAVDHDSHLAGDDAFGIAATTYFAATGNHPIYDENGKVSPKSTKSLAEFGFDDELATIVSAQFSEDTRELTAFIDGDSSELPREESEPELVSEKSEEEPSRQPTGGGGSRLVTGLAAVIVLLFIVNILTFLWAFQPEPQKSNVSVEPSKILPSGYLLESLPSDATVTDVTSGQELGRTPVTIDPTKLGGGRLELKIESRDHAPALISLAIDEVSSQHQFFVRLKDERP